MRLLERILIILSFKLCINQSFAAQISGVYSKQCVYLDITDTQNFNAYTDSGKLCCLCPAGTKFVDDCNSTHPSSTICEVCGPNTYREYSGHRNKECEFDAGIVCFPPFVTIPGTAMKKASCRCPQGQVEDGNSCIEDKKVSTIPPPPKIPFTPSPLTQPSTISLISTMTSGTSNTQNGLSSNTNARTRDWDGSYTIKNGSITQHSEEPKLAKQSETPAIEGFKVNTDANKEGINGRSTSKPDDVKQKEIKRPVGKGETYAEKGEEYTWMIAVVAIVVLTVVVLLVVLGIKHLKSRVQTALSAKDIVSVESSPSSSPDGSSTALISTSRQDQISDRVVETSLAGNGSEPIRAILVQECVPEQQNHEEAQLVQPPPERHGGIGCHDANPDFTHVYAREIGRGFGDKFGPNEILPFYRHLGLDDVLLDDMERKYEDDTPERVYKLTMLVHRKLGIGFTKDFLVDKVQSMSHPQQNLLPTIEDEWSKCQRRFNLN